MEFRENPLSRISEKTGQTHTFFLYVDNKLFMFLILVLP